MSDRYLGPPSGYGKSFLDMLDSQMNPDTGQSYPAGTALSEFDERREFMRDLPTTPMASDVAGPEGLTWEEMSDAKRAHWLSNVMAQQRLIDEKAPVSGNDLFASERKVLEDQLSQMVRGIPEDILSRYLSRSASAGMAKDFGGY